MELCSVGKFFKFRQTLGSIHSSALNREDGLSFGSWQGVLARIFYELLSRDREDGRATWQLVPRYRGIGSEAYLNGTSQEPTPEDARKDGHIRGRSK